MDGAYGWYKFRYFSTKSHTHKRDGTLRKIYFPQWGMLKFTNKHHFLTIEKTFMKLLY